MRVSDQIAFTSMSNLIFLAMFFRIGLAGVLEGTRTKRIIMFVCFVFVLVVPLLFAFSKIIGLAFVLSCYGAVLCGKKSEIITLFSIFMVVGVLVSEVFVSGMSESWYVFGGGWSLVPLRLQTPIFVALSFVFPWVLAKMLFILLRNLHFSLPGCGSDKAQAPSDA